MKILSGTLNLIILSIYFLLVAQIIHGQPSEPIIPPERRIDWDPGLPYSIPDYPVATNVMNYGAIGDGIADDTQAIKDAINATPEGSAVLIPEGIYLITSTLKITKGIVLRGEGAGKTRLLFDFSSGGNCISIEKWGASDWINMLNGFDKGSNTIAVANASPFNIGDFVELKQKNDPAIYSPGELGSFDSAAVGQILQITNISGNTLIFNKESYYNYNPAMNPRIRSFQMIEKAGVEKLHLERVDIIPSGSNISFTNAGYCWVREVWCEKTATAHILMARSYRNEIRDNYFHDSHFHGSGGQGYGIRMEEHSTDNLVENNIFERLRHSMLVQVGATGNVFGYNYSKDPFLEEGNNWLMSDVSAHGHYAYMNLYEGNTVQYILADNVWGTNGPTTFFRNRIEKDVIHYLNNSENFAFIEIGANNPYHNIVGNELGISTTYSNDPIKLDPSIANTIIVHGNYNYHDGTITWDPNIANHNLPDSYYLTQKPVWFGSLPWPLIGGDISPNTNLIPAQARYNEGNFIPVSDNVSPLPPNNLRVIK